MKASPEVVRCGPCLCVESGRPTAPGVPDPACNACAGSGFASLASPEVVRCGPCLCVESGRPTAPGVPDPACNACAGSGFASLDPEPGWHSDGAPLSPLVLTLTDEQSAILAAAFATDGGAR